MPAEITVIYTYFAIDIMQQLILILLPTSVSF